MIRKCIYAAAVAAASLCVRAASFSIDCTAEDMAACAPSALTVGDFLEVRLPDGAYFNLRLVSAPPPGIAGQSYIARDDGGSASAVVKPAKDGIRITIDDFENHRLFAVRVKDGKVSSTVLDTSPTGGDECGTCAGETAEPAVETPAEPTEAKSTRKPVRVLSSDDFSFAGQKSVVDILVAFDQGAVARSSALGYDTIEDFADYAVGKMNTVLVNSQIDDVLCYRLVGVVEMDGSWSRIDDRLLSSMRTSEGEFAKLSRLRNKYGADTVTLLVNRTVGTLSGIGFEYSGNAGKSAAYFNSMNYACNVCDINTVYSRYTMSHETGHNMGCGHSNRQGGSSGPGRYSDSCGYHFTDASYVRRSTIMAYTYAGDDNYYYDPVPYFSAPDISPSAYGCALGVEGVNNNRRTLTLTHADIASLREHVKPYDWDVRFVDANGNDIEDGAYFSECLCVWMTNANANATIYYTLDGTTPDRNSPCFEPGETAMLALDATSTVTACAVTNDVAISVRSATFNRGLAWSGEEGQNGNGVWADGKTSYAWDDCSRYFINGCSVAFCDMAANAAPTITVKGFVSPLAVDFAAAQTAYTFAKGDNQALISLHDAAFAPSGELTFNVPVSLEATSFTAPAFCTTTFNAPFGTNITAGAAFGYCTNMVVVGESGTLVVAPGAGKTQVFDRFNNTGRYWNTATFRVGKGTVRFKGPINGGNGLFGSTRVVVGNGGSLVFDIDSALGLNVSSPVVVEKGGSITFNSSMEILHRPLTLSGGAVYCKNRFDWYDGLSIDVTDDSSIEDLDGSAYVWIRFSHSRVNVEAGKSLALNIKVQDGYNTSGFGIVKTGAGEFVANKLLAHSGPTIVSNGTFTAGYSSSTAYGAGWTVAEGATLKVKAGCSLAVPSLALAGGATLEVPAASSAPLTVAGAVDLSGVRLVLDGASDLAEGKSYPVLKSSGGLGGVSGVVADDLPELAAGLEWNLEERSGTLFATVAGTSVPEAPARLPTVDMLVGFDIGAQSYVANKGMTMEEFAQAQIAKMNDALATNRLDVCYSYRLAGVCKVDATYTKIGDVSGDLVSGVGPLVSLRSARELCGADTVTLLVNNESDATLGYGCPLSSSTDVAACHDDAFSVCSITAVHTGRQHTMLHENAHNMGCGHARAQDQSNSPFEYGRGFYFKDGNVTRHTIMAYGGDNDASWYFSTSSGEFGFALGDATNDNARVLRETCGAVSGWRDAVRPFEDEAVAKVGGTDEEILSGRVFATNIVVELVAPNAGDAIVYTLDGSVPTGNSSVYSSPIAIDATTTLSFAVLGNSGMGPARTVKLFRIDSLGPMCAQGVTWYTSAKYPWFDDENGVLRSCNHTNYRYYCTTPLKAKVVGPKRLSFQEKSYFIGTSLTPNYSHFEVLLDDAVEVTETSCWNSWGGSWVDIPAGEHEVTFVYSQRDAMNNPLNYKDGIAATNDAVWLREFVLADSVSTVLHIPSGTTVGLSEVGSAVETITGEGTLVCDAELPAKGYGLTDEAWKGTVAFKNFNDDNVAKDFRVELYGNAKSKVKFTNCRIPYLKNNNATFAGTVVLDGDAALTTKDGYSSNYNVFGALEGDGAMKLLGRPMQWYVFNTATNFAGSISVEHGWYNGTVAQGRRIVFGTTASTEDLPVQSASITVKSGAEAAIGASATWYAYHGVEVAGTLIVKGANATLSCNEGGAMGLKIDGGATLRFGSADAKLTLGGWLASGSPGSVAVEFADGVVPADGQVLVDWSASPAVPSNAFSLAGGVASGWALAKEADALRIYKMPDATDPNVFSVPGSGVRFVADLDVVSQMNGYIEDWTDIQDFLEDTGGNGHPRWVSYVLGIDADSDRKVTADIKVVDGKVVITPCMFAREIPGLVLVTDLYGADGLSGNMPFMKTFRGRTVEVAPFEASGTGFYRMEVSIDAQ